LLFTDNALLYVPKHIVEEVFGTVQCPLELDTILTSDINKNVSTNNN